MQLFPPTVIWRHRKENLKKCSLKGLERRDDFKFYSYPGELPCLSNYILLDIEAEPLSEADCHFGLFVIDATWRYAGKMLTQVRAEPGMIARSLPEHYRTAYPRCQWDCPDPERGLSSIEALFVAYSLLGRDVSGLLDNYYWKEIFLKKNNFLLKA